MAKLRVIVADENPAFLRRLVSLLSHEFDVVATAADGESALEVIRCHNPDVAVVDLALPLLNGIQVLRRLARNNTSAVICSVYTDPEIVQAARQGGAMAYVFKAQVERDLVLAVKSAAEHKPFVSPQS